jgi:hypothetical protein
VPNTVWLLVLVPVAWGFARWWSQRSPAVREVAHDQLTEGEQHVLGVVREMHGEAILAEKLTGRPGDVRVQLQLDPAKSELKDLDIGLSSLARKQAEDGLTDAALQTALRF